MINTFVMVGVIHQVHISESKRKDKTTAAVLLRYGDDRNQSGMAVEFINAALMRIPPYRLPSVRDRLKVGAFVHVIGHVQGVFKSQAGQGVFEVELVVDRIDFVQGLNSVHYAYRKGRDAPANGNGADHGEASRPAQGAGEEAGADAILSGEAECGAGGPSADSAGEPAEADAVA